MVDDDRCDQITTDHEEHIDADEPAGRGAGKGVVGDDRENRDRAEAIDVGAVLRAVANGRHRGFVAVSIRAVFT